MNGNQDSRNRAYWLKTLHQWHWISSALCLVGMLLFSITGVTLNHASQIEANPRTESRELNLPESLRGSLVRDGDVKAGPLPDPVARWIAAELSIDLIGRAAEWSKDEIYVPLPRPGGDAWMRIALPLGEIEYERTDRGWISYLNDLHKGRNTGSAWGWFIDVFAVATLVFSITGLFILKLHAANRPSTWPVIGFGLALPALLAILFIH